MYSQDSSSDVDGRFHLTCTAVVRLSKPVMRSEMRQKVEDAMVRLRHLAPMVATSTSFSLTDNGSTDESKGAKNGNGYGLEYHVPSGLEETRIWAGHVTLMRADAPSVWAVHAELGGTLFWRSAIGRNNVELHFTPSGDRWAFTYVYALSYHLVLSFNQCFFC